MKVEKTTVMTISKDELQRIVGKAFTLNSPYPACYITETTLSADGEIEKLVFTIKEEVSI